MFGGEICGCPRRNGIGNYAPCKDGLLFIAFRSRLVVFLEIDVSGEMGFLELSVDKMASSDWIEG